MTFEKSIVCQLFFAKIFGDEGRTENDVADSPKTITKGLWCERSKFPQ